MKKQLLLTRMLLLFALIVGSTSVWGQTPVTLYSESFGDNGSSNTAFASYSGYSATTDMFTGSGTVASHYTGAGKVGKNSVDVSDYDGASGFSAAWYTGSKNTTTDVLIISNIDIEGYKNLNLSFGIKKSNGTESTNKTTVSYKIDNGEYQTLSFTHPTTADWALKSGSISGTGTSLTIKFTMAVTGGFTTRYDDIKVTGIEDTPAFDIAAQSNNTNYGTVSLSGSVITGSPKSGCRYATPAYTVSPANSATVSQDGDIFTVTPSANTTVTINFEAIPSHNVTWNVNGATTVESYKEGEDVEFPSNPSTIAGKVFKGWSSEAIDGTTDVAPSYVTEATMGNSDVTYYAVFASEVTAEGNVSLTINKDTKNFPDSYGTANTFEECNLEGVNFQIQQAFVNTSTNRLQWRASGHESGTGTMYNDDALNKIQSIVLNYDGDNNKNFTVKVGDNKNPTSGTEITPSTSGNVYTFDCSTYNKSYFVMTNGTGAGYLSSIVINYIGETTIIKQYCTTIPATVSSTITEAGWNTFSSNYALDLSKISGGTAYVATESGENVTMTKTTAKVAAGEGLMIMGTPGETFTIDVTSEDTEDVDNLLVGLPNGGTVTRNNNNYVFAWTTGNVSSAGFYFVNDAEPVLGAGKAYLHTIGGGAAKLNIIIADNETDGINAVVNEQAREGVYDLQGRKVTNPTKGLYIVNGKKVVIK